MTPSRGIRFHHPDFDAGTPGFGLSLRGGLDTVEDEAAVRQALLLLISTLPGERVMRPDYGCDLRQLAFAPNDATTAGLAIFLVRRAVERFEPRAEIAALDAGPDRGHPDRLAIALRYRLRATRREGTLEFAVDLAGGGADA